MGRACPTTICASRLRCLRRATRARASLVGDGGGGSDATRNNPGDGGGGGDGGGASAASASRVRRGGDSLVTIASSALGAFFARPSNAARCRPRPRPLAPAPAMLRAFLAASSASAARCSETFPGTSVRSGDDAETAAMMLMASSDASTAVDANDDDSMETRSDARTLASLPDAVFLRAPAMRTPPAIVHGFSSPIARGGRGVAATRARASWFVWHRIESRSAAAKVF